MRKVLFATTAAGLVAFSGAASAQGVSVFGDGRLGLQWDDSRPENELQASSRVRFGVNLSGETPTGITFGGTIRADNASGGAAGTAGNIFVSGVYGTLTFGDTNGADRQAVRDITSIGYTDLGDIHETPHLSNARAMNQMGGLRDIFGIQNERPTVRYDYDFGTLGFPGLAFSASTDSRLNDIAVGLGYGLDLAGFGIDLGVGWSRLDAAYTVENGDVVSIGITPGTTSVDQFSATIGASGTGAFGDYGVKATYTRISEALTVSTLGVGVTAGFGEIGMQAFAHTMLDDVPTERSTAYGIGASYDLGGGALLRGGYIRNFNDANTADLGIRLSF